MNVRSSERPGHRPSRLVEMIRSLGAGHGSAAVGFRRPEAGSKRVTAVVAGFAARDIDAAIEAVRAGVDAVEFDVTTDLEVAAVKGALERVKVPVGISLGADSAESLSEAAAGSDVDWVRLPLGSGVSSMVWTRPSRLLTVPIDLDLELARGLGGLNVDAILVESASAGRTDMTYFEALRLRALGSFINRPIILNAVQSISPQSVLAAEHLGVDALFLPTGTALRTITDYLEALAKRSSVTV